MANTVNDYLRFSANSMKDLIKTKLNENTNFTDQNFEDSNLSTLLDLFAYMFSVLMFYLNTSASESIFTDSQIYENLNRIVKMLGYNPLGYVPATTNLTLGVRDGTSFADKGLHVIPKYATVDTGLSDSFGNQIYYTLIDDYGFNANSTTAIDSDFTPTAYNGRWKLHDQTFVATGIPLETFTLSNIQLAGTDPVYIGHGFVEVLTKKVDGTYERWSAVTNLFNSTAIDRHFELRINEDKLYTLKFGDNIYGKRLDEDSILYVIYLQTNGQDGEIGATAIGVDAVVEVAIDGMTTDFIDTVVLNRSENPELMSSTELAKLTVTNAEAATLFKDLEGVADIRAKAPDWFRMGSRLITSQDFKQYILANYSTSVHDVAIMNNWRYMTEFQQWLYSYDKLTVDIINWSYKYADSCDFNNIYIWAKSLGNADTSLSLKSIIQRDCDRLKPVTSEVVLMDPFIVTIAPYMKGSYSTKDWDPLFENKIVLVRDRNTMISVERIRQKAISIVQDFFSIALNTLGGTINIDDLFNQLSAIDGVASVRMRYIKTGEPDSTASWYDGLSFRIWTQKILEGIDQTTISGSWQLKDFQFISLLDSDTISNRLEVMSDNYSISEVEY